MNSVQLYIDKQSFIFLIDTGASLSIIKDSSIPQIYTDEIHREFVRITGIGGQTTTEGYVRMILHYKNITFAHKFHIFKELPKNIDGIIGQDFLIRYGALIDFEKKTLTVQKKEYYEIIPMNLYSLEAVNKAYNIKLPARCEKIVEINTNYRNDCVIKANEVCKGVFVANSLSKCSNGKIVIRLINTRETEVVLHCLTPEIQPLEDYNCYTFEEANKDGKRVRKLLEMLKLDKMNNEEKLEISKICAKFADIFHLPGDKLNICNLYEQKIHLKTGVSPVYSKPYRLPHAQKTEIKKQIQEMIDSDIIEESTSEWSSPLLIVPKKLDASGERKWRIVLDYRKLNECIQDDKFPLPNITEILDSLSGAMYFSHLDLNQGYYQIRLDPESRKYTAFVADKHYQMKRLPMGLKTSPSAFSRAMTIALSGLNYDKCIVYLDDIIVVGRNLNQHNKNLIDVFTRLRKVNMRLNPSKCNFLKKELLYLGHIVTPTGIKPDPDKIKAIEKYPVPKNADEVKRFVAFANYYRKFIPDFAKITISLNKLTRKNAKFEWNKDCQIAFETLQDALKNPPLLQYPNFEQENEFILHTDASGLAIGCVLSNGNKLPVAYASRALNQAERNYPVIERELLAIVWAVKYFRPYLYGRKFKICTDHRPLIYLFNMNNPSSRLTKFRLCLEEYNFVIEYTRGKDNAAADALSRIIITSDELKSMSNKINTIMAMTRRQRQIIQKDENKKTKEKTKGNETDDWTDHPRVVEITKKPKSYIELSFDENEYRKNELCNKGIRSENGTFMFTPIKSMVTINPSSGSWLKRDFVVKELEEFCKKLKIKELCIIRNGDNKKIIMELAKIIKGKSKWQGPRLCVIQGVKKVENKDDQKVILNDFHILPSSGHAGIRRMTNNIKRHYYWTNMDNDIVKFVKRCEKCQIQKYHKSIKQPMCITSTAFTAFEKVYLDIVGPLNRDANGYVYILTLQCELTKYVEAYPIPNKEAETVARAFVDNFILRYGIPCEIATDRGTEFISAIMKDVCKLLNVNQIQATAYHHESIGSLENSHKSLGAFLRIQTDNQSQMWSSWIPYWSFAYNTTVHSETKFTPFELVFGKLCNVPTNLLSKVDPIYNYDNYPIELKYRLQKSQLEARENLIKSKERRKIVHDKKLNIITYKTGDLILIKNENRDKLGKIYLGPFTVISDMGENVKIKENNKENIVHKNRTKPYYV